MNKKQLVKGGTKSTILKRRFWLPRRVRSFSLNGLFKGSGYDIMYDHGSNQSDWMKFHGMYLDFHPHGRTVMLAFRYNPDLDMYEWTFYWHKITNTDKFKEVGRYAGFVNDSNIIRTNINIDENGDAYTVIPECRFIVGLKSIVCYASVGSDEIYSYGQFNKTTRGFMMHGNLYTGGSVPLQSDSVAHKSIVRIR